MTAPHWRARFRVTAVPLQTSVQVASLALVIDFASYAIVPAYMIYESYSDGRLLWNLAATFLILWCRRCTMEKRGWFPLNDYYFVGFPVLWNLFGCLFT